MAQAEIILTAAILDGLITKIADVLRCLAHMHQEGFLSLTDICQTSTGVNTWISITLLLKQWDVITHACRESNVEVKVSIMDIQKIIPLHCA